VQPTLPEDGPVRPSAAPQPAPGLPPAAPHLLPPPDGRAPGPTDAKARATVLFISGKRRRLGTLTYWPGKKSTRRPTVVGRNGNRYYPLEDQVWVIPSASVTPKGVANTTRIV
jgi:hypothetical protein